MSKWLSEPLIKAARSIVVLVSHFVEAIVMLGLIKLLQLFVGWLGLAGDLLWGRVPLAYLFDTLDVVVIVVFIIWGAIDYWKAHKGEEEGRE